MVFYYKVVRKNPKPAQTKPTINRIKPDNIAVFQSLDDITYVCFTRLQKNNKEVIIVD